MERRNRNLGIATALAVLGVNAGGDVLPPAPPAQDQKQPRRQRAVAGGNYIPFPLVKSTPESVGAPRSNRERREKRARRKERMQLRKRRGWR